MTDHYALIGPDNVVKNMIVWDGESEYPLSEGFYLIKTRRATIGDIYSSETNTFSRSHNGSILEII